MIIRNWSQFYRKNLKMRMYRFNFYRVEYDKNDNKKQSYLGYLDVIDSKLPDGCSVYAKAFRLANAEQKMANAVDVQEL
jgi:hypothetical protein